MGVVALTCTVWLSPGGGTAPAGDGANGTNFCVDTCQGIGTVRAASGGDVTEDDTGPGSAQWLTDVDIAEVAHALRQRMGRETTRRVDEDQPHARIVTGARGGGVGNRGAQPILAEGDFEGEGAVVVLDALVVRKLRAGAVCQCDGTVCTAHGSPRRSGR